MTTVDRPRIGISANILHADPDRSIYDGRPLLYLEQSMATWLMRAGAAPFMVPFAPDDASVETTLAELVAQLDGLVLHGGADVAPESYGREPIRAEWSGDIVRDRYELELIEACMERGVPIFGVCRGMQVLNVYFGGTLYQDIATEVDAAITHRDLDHYDELVHPVEFVSGSRLAKLYSGRAEGRVVSVHHQAIRGLGEELEVEARAPDGVIEAIRWSQDSAHDTWVAGIQWHPEFQDPATEHLLDPTVPLDDFLAVARRRRRATSPS